MARDRKSRRAAEREEAKVAKRLAAQKPPQQEIIDNDTSTGFRTRRNILRLLLGSAAAVGVEETVRRSLFSEPEQTADVIAPDSPIEALLREFVEAGHKRIYFSDKQHWVPENIGFFAKEVIPAFKKVLPANAKGLVAIELPNEQMPEFLAEFRSASSHEQKKELVTKLMELTIVYDVLKKQGRWDELSEVLVTLFKNPDENLLQQLWVDVPPSYKFPNSARVENAVNELLRLQAEKKTNTAEYDAMEAEYMAAGAERVAITTPIYQKRINEAVPDGYSIGFFGAGHYLGSSALQLAANSPVVTVNVRPGKLEGYRIENTSENQRLIHVADSKARANYELGMAEIQKDLSLSANTNDIELSKRTIGGLIGMSFTCFRTFATKTKTDTPEDINFRTHMQNSQKQLNLSFNANVFTAEDVELVKGFRTKAKSAYSETDRSENVYLMIAERALMEADRKMSALVNQSRGR